eukprot:scaffold16692_cov84-Skeletonema_dohrnii-CCMP3373.AAC.4
MPEVTLFVVAVVCLNMLGGSNSFGSEEKYSDRNMLMLVSVVAKLHGLSSKSIDFVLAFPQVEVDAEIYMNSSQWIRAGIWTCINYYKLFSSSIAKSIRSQAGILQLVSEAQKGGLIARGFHPSPSKINQKGMIVLTYVDDCIIVGNSVKEIDDH